MSPVAMTTYVDVKELNVILRSLEFILNRAPPSEMRNDLCDAQILLQKALYAMEKLA